MEVLRRNIPWVVAFALALLLVTSYEVTVAPPSDFTPGTLVRIARGTSVPEIANELQDAHIIKHAVFLRALLRLTGKSDAVQTGLYKFDVPTNLFAVAYRLAVGDYGIPPARITFIEGVTIREAAVQVAHALPDIVAADFVAAAQGQEGYLFPDTYVFQPGVDAKSIIHTMRSNFDTKMSSLSQYYTSTERSLGDIVTMASLVEKEARTIEDKHIVAGILWNRIRLGMPLQVDAVFGYIFSRTTYSPSPADLHVKSPYNTYIHTGLPPTPIDNPGLDSLKAAIQPTKSNYLYYLTGKDGLMHYAATYAGHQANLRKYLQ